MGLIRATTCRRTVCTGGGGPPPQARLFLRLAFLFSGFWFCFTMPAVWSDCSGKRCHFRCLFGVCFFDLVRSGEDGMTKWLVQHDFLKNSPKCSNPAHGEEIMVLDDYKGRKVYRCPVRTCRRQKSCRKGFFVGRLPPDKILLIIIMTSRRYSSGQIHSGSDPFATLLSAIKLSVSDD